MSNVNLTRAQRRRAQRKAATGRAGFFDNPTNKALAIGGGVVLALLLGYSIYTKIPSTSTASTPPAPPAQPVPANPQPKPQPPATPPATVAATTAPKGEVKIEDVKTGTGASPKPGDQVTVHYTGTLEDGTKFDSSVDKGQPYTFTFGQGVIDGWTQGLATMKAGGRRKLVIPPGLAYGPAGRGKIPANATLLFDIELLKVEPAAK